MIIFLLDLAEDVMLRIVILVVAYMFWMLLLLSLTYTILTTPVKKGYKP